MWFTLVLVSFGFLYFTNALYQIPEITFEAFSPEGLRISIPAEEKTRLFAFQGKVNVPIQDIEPGDISHEVLRPHKGRLTFFEPTISLKNGDIIYYWVFVVHDGVGFRKSGTYTVNDFSIKDKSEGDTDAPCFNITKISGQGSVCPGKEFIYSKFSKDLIKPEVWTTEEYIPDGPDWPFHIYQKDPSVIQIFDGVLRIKPMVKAENAKKTIDLGARCTRTGAKCRRVLTNVWNPPVVSAQLRSTTAFCFGNVTVRAKLPIGDYVYSEIYLEDVSNPEKRLLIAFARGNMNYVKDGLDIGGKTVYGGPYINASVPVGTTSDLSSYTLTEHVGTNWHTFEVYWTRREIKVIVDKKVHKWYAPEQLRDTGFDKEDMVRLVLGVGVAGPYMFPDDYTSSGHSKPYRSKSVKAIKDFLANRSNWENTWNDDTELQVDYVIVTSV